MPGEPLDQLHDQLDPGACRLANLPGRIWLFGGKGGFRMGSPDPCESLRESFWRQSMALPTSPGRAWVTDLDIPENHPGWWAFSGYDDLLTFERDACHLARERPPTSMTFRNVQVADPRTAGRRRKRH